MDRRLFAMAMLGAALTAGCSAADTGYRAGELGNGGFYFSCDDAVACARYSAKFPRAVSLGSTFQVRFVSKTSANDTHITFNESASDRGITISPVGEYISRSPGGLVARKSGYATITSRDAAGRLVDFVNVRVAKPDALVVYPADESGQDPRGVDTVSITTNDSRSYRALAKEQNEVLGGSLAVEWRAEPTGILDVETTSEGKATVVGRTPGTATLFATAGTFEQQITVEVK